MSIEVLLATISYMQLSQFIKDNSQVLHPFQLPVETCPIDLEAWCYANMAENLTHCKIYRVQRYSQTRYSLVIVHGDQSDMCVQLHNGTHNKYTIYARKMNRLQWMRMVMIEDSDEYNVELTIQSELAKDQYEYLRKPLLNEVGTETPQVPNTNMEQTSVHSNFPTPYFENSHKRKYSEDEDNPVNLFFGSSAVNTFSLLNDPTIRICKFKGATAKGLGQGNEKYHDIMKLLNGKYAGQNVKSITWMFGTVDCKFTYFYKLCNAKDDKELEELYRNPQNAMIECADTYIQSIKSISDYLQEQGKCIRMNIIGVEPNGMAPALTYEQCVRYAVIQDTPQNKARVSHFVTKMHPERLRRFFNRHVQLLCNLYGFKMIHVDNVILENVINGPDCSIVKEQYRDPYPTCVHLNWEEMVIIYAKQLNSQCNMSLLETLDLKATRKAYLEEKAQRPQRRKMMPEKNPTVLRGIDSERPQRQ